MHLGARFLMGIGSMLLLASILLLMAAYGLGRNEAYAMMASPGNPGDQPIMYSIYFFTVVLLIALAMMAHGKRLPSLRRISHSTSSRWPAESNGTAMRPSSS